MRSGFMNAKQWFLTCAALLTLLFSAGQWNALEAATKKNDSQKQANGSKTPQPKILHVPSKKFPTIQSAINSLKKKGDAGYTRIKIAPGTYDEFISIEGFTSNTNFVPLEFQNGDAQTDLGDPGFQILGDDRPFIGFSYANGYERAGDSNRAQKYLITTTNPASGPYDAFIASSFGAIGGVTDVGAQNAVPLNACGSLTNQGLSGQVAVIERGACTFTSKTKNAQIAGAAAAVIWNNASSGIVTMGGTDSTITIPAFSISNADGLTLSDLIAKNPGIKISITPTSGIYYPPLGTNFAIAQLTHPGDDRSIIQVAMTDPLPVADDNILAPPVLEQPLFDSPTVGIVPGDYIALADSDILGNFAKSLHQITAVNGNIIEITPPVLPVAEGGVDITALGANITFLPNVRIKPTFNPAQLPTTLFKTFGVNFSMTGIWIDQDPSFPFAYNADALDILSGTVAIANIAVTDFTGNALNGLAIHTIDTDAYIVDGYRDDGQEKHLSVIGWAGGIGVSSMGMLRGGGGHLFIAGSGNSSGGASIGSSIGVSSIQIFGAQNNFQPNGAAYFLGDTTGDWTGVELNVDKILHIVDVYGHGIAAYGSRVVLNNPSMRIERCYCPALGNEGISPAAGAILVSPQSEFHVLRGEYNPDGSPRSQPRLSSVIRDCFDLTHIFGPGFTVPQVGIYVDGGGVFRTQGQLTFKKNDLNYKTVQDGIFNAYEDHASVNNILQVNKNGKLNSVFETQALGPNALTITLNPGEKFGFDPLYEGKTYTLYATSSAKNRLQLSKKASFIGHSGQTLEFTKEGAFVTFKVVSATEILLLDFKNIKIRK